MEASKDKPALKLKTDDPFAGQRMKIAVPK